MHNKLFKNILILILLVLSLSSCNMKFKEYEKNCNEVKALIEKINSFFKSEDVNDLNISSYYTNDFIFNSYPEGFRKGIKTNKLEYINNLNKLKKSNISLEIVHVIYMPGLDENSYEIDGSVRIYYGAVLSSDSNKIEYSGYQTINFFDNKIKEIWDWADYGGVNEKLKKLTTIQ